MPRLLFLALLAVALGGCLATHPRLGPPADTPVFRPEVFFEGRTRGDGTLTIRARGSQSVRVESRGQWLGDGTFQLAQTIRFGDDEPFDRSWTFRRDGAEYAVTLTEAEGPVNMEVSGSELRLRYETGRFSSVEQTLQLQPGGQVALNQLTAYVLGIPVARIEETIRRVDRY